jgi:hypothetical protein
MTLPNSPKGNPQVVSDTEGEEITPDNPEIVRQFPVDPNNPEQVEEVEGTEDAEPPASGETLPE